MDMDNISRKEFLNRMGLLGTSVALFDQTSFASPPDRAMMGVGVAIGPIEENETVFTYIHRMKGEHDLRLYRQVIGAANAFKEGDLSLGVAAAEDVSRQRARTLLSNTQIGELTQHAIFKDDLFTLIEQTTSSVEDIQNWTMGRLKKFILDEPEAAIQKIMPSLTSDCIGCLVKLMSNQELILVGQKVFNPLPNSKIGSKGYLSARVQPNSPTDNEEDIVWQVFDAWSYAVGDLVLGTNPVSSEVESVARIEKTLFDLLTTFGLKNTMPNCVLSHIDIQAEVEKIQPGTTGIWFQSLAGTVAANHTFDVSIPKMKDHISQRTGQYGLYAETGQGADYTNGHGEGFDMVLHESRKYGFIRALKGEASTGLSGASSELSESLSQISLTKTPEDTPWFHVNDVAGFIRPGGL
jgi:ethanolamine ammonia-lyase large subunit